MISFFCHLFPPTIHPMVIHFTIAIVYLALLSGIIGPVIRKNKTLTHVFTAMLVLGILSTLAAGIAGVISEYYLPQISGTVRPILHTHKNYGELTGVLLGAALLVQCFTWWRLRGKVRVSVVALILTIGAVITVSVAGHLGGVMVYQHGLGVHFS